MPLHLPQPPAPQRLSLGRIVPATCILLLLHFGQDVLRPIAIAAILSLVIAPLVRKLARTGMGRTAATLLSVLLVAVGVVWMSAVLAIQLVAVAGDLPRYSAAITSKVQSIREVTVRPFERLEAEFRGVAPQARPASAPAPAPTGAQRRLARRARKSLPDPSPSRACRSPSGNPGPSR